jgi:NADH:ubiquinone oxidoreductase subunit 6 (subunit J)
METFLCALAATGIVVGSVFAVASRKLFASVLGFGASMFFLGAMYLVLNQSLLALLHIIVYVGGVAVLALFAYVTSISAEEVEERNHPFNLLAILSSIVVFLLILFGGLELVKGVNLASYKEIGAAAAGRILLGQRLFEFEFISVLLLVALLASIAVAVGGRKDG